MKDVLVSFGRRVAELRTKMGITQEKLAEMTGYSTNHIAKLESARTNPSFELLIQIANALDVEPKELLNFETYKSPEYIRKKLTKVLNVTDEKTLKNLYDFYKMLKTHI